MEIFWRCVCPGEAGPLTCAGTRGSKKNGGQDDRNWALGSHSTRSKSRESWMSIFIESPLHNRPREGLKGVCTAACALTGLTADHFDDLLRLGSFLTAAGFTSFI